MGRRKKQKDLNADGGMLTPADDEGMVGAEVKVKLGKRNRREATASLVNEANMMSEIGSLDAVETAGKASKRMNRSKGRQSARRSKEETSSEGGEARAKATFSWTSATEIIILSELVELVNTDTGHAADRSGTAWVKLAATLGERLGYRFKRRQVYEKVRRLRERYRKILNKGGKLSSFKNGDDEKVHSLCDQVWGATQALSVGGKLHFPKREKLLTQSKRARGPLGALRLHLEEEHGVVGKEASERNNRDKDENTSPDGVEVETLRGLDLALLSGPIDLALLGGPIEPNQGATAAADVQANAESDVASRSKARRAFEGDIQETLEGFRAEHRAVVKELEKRCAAVVEDTQAKLVSMMSNHPRSAWPWGGGGGNAPSFGVAVDVPFTWDKLVSNCVAASADKPAALQNLYEQWQQQRLQELKLTSMRLHLMLEDCKMEQEKLEKQVVKPK